MDVQGLKKVFVGSMLLGTVSALTAGQVWAAGNNRLAFVEDELLVQLKAGAADADIDDELKGHGAFAVDEISQIRVKRIKVPANALENVKAALARNPNIDFVEPNFLAQSGFTPNDTNYPSQWHWNNIAAPQGWDLSTGANDILIAVIDSGIDPTHPDLAAKLVPGWNFVGNNADTHDVLGHGTAVAGAAGALSNNAAGVAGMAWQNPIMPLVVLDATDYASYANIASAITYAADHGAWVINISIGGSSSSSTLQNAVNYAWNKGVTILASAMNNANSTPYYPAACTNVVAVSATTSSNTLASFSSFGTWVDVAAPGANILTTNRGGGYGAWNGTSFASPIAAGLAAVMLSVNPLLSNAELVALLEQNTDDLGTAGFDQYFGWGKINAQKSIAAAKNFVATADAIAPAVSFVSPGNGTTVSGTVTVNVTATDNVGVTKVDLFVDGKLQATDTAAPYSFALNTATLANGTHTLVVQAADAAGNVGQSQVAVTVNNQVDSTAPVAAVTAPANGATISGTKLTVKASATDNVGVARIELYIDGALKSSASGATLSYTWNISKLAAGAHSITARAFDAAGNAGTSSITVTR